MIDKGTSIQEAWRIAIRKEQEARQFYLEASKMMDDEAMIKLFEFLAGEEAKHERILQDDYDRYFVPEW